MTYEGVPLCEAQMDSEQMLGVLADESDSVFAYTDSMERTDRL